MSSATAPQVLNLYRRLLRESRKFPSYNYRLHAVSRVKHEFHLHEGEKNPKKVEELLKKGEESLQLIKRQVVLGNMFSTDKLVIENLQRN